MNFSMQKTVGRRQLDPWQTSTVRLLAGSFHCNRHLLVDKVIDSYLLLMMMSKFSYFRTG